VATALAKYDFPVPGGPYNRKALQGRLFPVRSNKTTDKAHNFTKRTVSKLQ